MRTQNIIALCATVTALLNPAQAGGQNHVLTATRPHDQYVLKVAAAPRANEPLVVTLEDARTGRPVAGAHVAMLRPVAFGMKHAPASQFETVSLTDEGGGRYLCGGEHHAAGAFLTFRAHVPDDGAVVWTTARVNG